MSDAKSLDAKKAILDNLNNMINAHKEYYESLKFKLVTDAKVKKKARVSKTNKKPYPKLSETDYELKLPCHIIKNAFDDSHATLDRRFRDHRENFSFIRKLVKQNKAYFIQCVDKQNKRNSEQPRSENFSEFASCIINDLLTGVVNESCTDEKPSKSISVNEQCETFAENLCSELFSELKLDNMSQHNLSNNNVQSLPDFLIEKPNDLSNEEAEEHDTLDDMSSLNSSIGSNCIVVNNYLMKRRHSADVVRTIDRDKYTLWVNKHNRGPLLGDIYKNVRHFSLQEIPNSIMTRRHSVNSFSMYKTSNSILTDQTSYSNNSSDLVRSRSRSSSKLNSKEKIRIMTHRLKQYGKLTVTKQLKRVLGKLFGGSSNDNKQVMDIIDGQVKKKQLQKDDQSAKFVDNLFENVWEESMKTVAEIIQNVKTNFSEVLVDDIFAEAFHDIQIISHSIKEQNRFYFKCECPAHQSSSGSSKGDINNINCLLSVYCMMIALAEFNLTNQITFICCHFT